jgi:hypothetical protein
MAAARNTEVVFMTAAKPGASEYRRVTDPAELAKYREWMDNDAARWALQMYSRALGIARARGGAKSQPDAYHIALVPDGNFPGIDFRMDGRDYKDAAFILLGPTPDRFATTLIHETGHVAAAILSSGYSAPRKQMIPVPHTTAALTDRGTAFDEGLGIALETLAGHLFGDERIRRAYHHDSSLFGIAHARRSEFFRPSTDLLTFAQTASRYYDVRENRFAFESAFTGPEYFRVQFEKTRDMAVLRDANQLLQSEGFYATFFSSWLLRGEERPSVEVAGGRQARMLEALADMFASRKRDPDAPYLLWFVEAYAKRYPGEKAELVDALLDLSHGVFVDPEAAAMWRDHYLAALKLDIQNAAPQRFNDARARWREAVLKDYGVLYSRVGPQIRCRVKGVQVELKALGRAAPLSFDANTVQHGVLRMIPGISDAEVERWVSERAKKPYADPADFNSRSGLRAQIAETLVW